jgi:hypothetical protein
MDKYEYEKLKSSQTLSLPENIPVSPIIIPFYHHILLLFFHYISHLGDHRNAVAQAAAEDETRCVEHQLSRHGTYFGTRFRRVNVFQLLLTAFHPPEEY